MYTTTFAPTRATARQFNPLYIALIRKYYDHRVQYLVISLCKKSRVACCLSRVEDSPVTQYPRDTANHHRSRAPARAHPDSTILAPPHTPTSIGRGLSWRARDYSVCRPIGVPGFSVQPFVLHVQQSGRTLSLRHVRSRSDERVLVGRWIVMCSAPKGVDRVRCKTTTLKIRTLATVLTTP